MEKEIVFTPKEPKEDPFYPHARVLGMKLVGKHEFLCTLGRNQGPMSLLPPKTSFRGPTKIAKRCSGWFPNKGQLTKRYRQLNHNQNLVVRVYPNPGKEFMRQPRRFLAGTASNLLRFARTASKKHTSCSCPFPGVTGQIQQLINLLACRIGRGLVNLVSRPSQIREVENPSYPHTPIPPT